MIGGRPSGASAGRRGGRKAKTRSVGNQTVLRGIPRRTTLAKNRKVPTRKYVDRVLNRAPRSRNRAVFYAPQPGKGTLPKVATMKRVTASQARQRSAYWRKQAKGLLEWSGARLKDLGARKAAARVMSTSRRREIARIERNFEKAVIRRG